MDETLRSVLSSRGILKQKISLKSLTRTCKDWIHDLYNLALLLWITCVSVSGAILFLVMIGLLNNLLPSKSQRDGWFEVNNQILNALFTLMCLYNHPKRIHHSVLLCRWNPNDISKLRKIYCKNGTHKPSEWKHMMILLLLLHLNCLAQYALCGLNLGYKNSERSIAGVAICLAIAISAAAAAGLYSIFSPLGKDQTFDDDEEIQNRILKKDGDEKRDSLTFTSRIVDKPQWRGGLFDFMGEIKTTYLSFFCSFCVFGWNMERLGFGNSYVHIFTFVIFCSAPFVLFSLAANVSGSLSSSSTKIALNLTGILLSVFGLLYGGYWRVQMRERFNLPKSKNSKFSDCGKWLFCSCCSLAQEVRTVDYYEIIEDKLCIKQNNDDDNDNGNGKIEMLLSPLPRENGVAQFRSSSSALPIWNNAELSEVRMGKSLYPNKILDDIDVVNQTMMKPPDQLSMEMIRNDLEGGKPWKHQGN